MMPARRVARLGILAVAAMLPLAAEAQRSGGGRSTLGDSLPAPGLSAAFAGGAACAPIASPYGSPTRYDGSSRPSGGAEGAHGGIDLTLAEGTPLRAVAAGRVFASGAGGMMEGVFLWILHLPEATGLGFAFLAKYQHLREPSPLRVGDTVTLGQEVARSGKTGTVGGHYGAFGYPHLHLTVRALTPESARRAAAGGEIRILGDSVMVDPLTIYVPDLRSPADAAALTPKQKRLTIASVAADGTLRPAEARSVWPVACP
jgi:murein DD-endopeptidase MepM/ murein hydrolase activator NlpD